MANPGPSGMANPGQSEPTRMASASQLRALNRLRAEALGLAIGSDASLSIKWSGVVRIRPRDRGALDRVAPPPADGLVG
jgi:hypothetical protein